MRARVCLRSWFCACSNSAAFKAWDAKVRASVPSRQLLVFETGKHGYKELAHFLGVKEPAGTNSRSEFAAVIALFRTLAALTVGVLCAFAWCVLRRARGGKPKHA